MLVVGVNDNCSGRISLHCQNTTGEVEILFSLIDGSARQSDCVNVCPFWIVQFVTRQSKMRKADIIILLESLDKSESY